MSECDVWCVVCGVFVVCARRCLLSVSSPREVAFPRQCLLVAVISWNTSSLEANYTVLEGQEHGNEGHWLGLRLTQTLVKAKRELDKARS